MDSEDFTNDAQARHFDNVFFREDPWNYRSEYEQLKYSHTLEMIPQARFERALEVGCAEGLFTEQLAKRVAHLTAVDVSERALSRARQRLGGAANVAFERSNIANRIPPGPFDLIVCSEVLYYLKNRFVLRRVAKRFSQILADGGYLVMTHPNAVSDDRSSTGFDFNEFGAQFIGRVFARRSGLEFVRELRTSLYRVQVFRKPGVRTWNSSAPREVITRSDAKDVAGLPADAPYIAVKRGGVLVTQSEARHCWTSPQIPILMYHRVATEGPEILAPWRISPGKFEAQLAYLQRHGYESIGIEKACALIAGGRPPAGRYVVLTFDDAYEDFAEVAWPLVRAYGFSATVFVPTAFVGKTAEWDAQHGPTPPLMSWDVMRRLAAEGVTFGGHGHTHRRLTTLSGEEVVEEGRLSRSLLQAELGREISLFCYPFNARNETVIASMKQAGYGFAVGAGGLLRPGFQPLDLPREEILGTDEMETFIGQLGVPGRTPLRQRLRYRYLRAMRDRRTYMGH
jgi:peptidoglycan/xylan/chitin deacetylase (PgdA/CDA1 family)/2-polyprenyl-3-methyl-5-hydroxy-6-metoxy-1,4-benzoquinol methylase